MRSNKGQLVSQHLENISRTALEKYQNILKELVKGRHGIYALYRGGGVKSLLLTIATKKQRKPLSVLAFMIIYKMLNLPCNAKDEMKPLIYFVAREINIHKVTSS